MDYVKLDGCYSHPNDMDKGYPEFGYWLNQTGRPMIYACSWPVYQTYSGMTVKKRPKKDREKNTFIFSPTTPALSTPATSGETSMIFRIPGTLWRGLSTTTGTTKTSLLRMQGQDTGTTPTWYVPVCSNVTL